MLRGLAIEFKPRGLTAATSRADLARPGGVVRTAASTVNASVINTLDSRLAVGCNAIRESGLTRSIDYWSEREQWTEVLRAADRLPGYRGEVRSERNIVLALYHTGRLGDEQYRYSVRVNARLFGTPEAEQDWGSYYQEGRLLLELGRVNEAEKCSFESLETAGDRPAVLAQLATISLVKRQPETACIFLSALDQHPFQRQVAQELMRQLDEDPGLEQIPRVAQIRANALVKDHANRYESIAAYLTPLLKWNPDNRLAFELLMAHHLDTGSLDRATRDLAQRKDCGGYMAVPRPGDYPPAATLAATPRSQPGPRIAVDRVRQGRWAVAAIPAHRQPCRRTRDRRAPGLPADRAGAQQMD
jgi:tetratricopeptide (TPR) repeat protein